MKDSRLTYGQLHDKLRSLGFDQRSVEVDGRRGQAFLHKDISNALITLPERDLNEKVESFDLNSVLANLKAHNLLPESNGVG